MFVNLIFTCDPEKDSSLCMSMFNYKQLIKMLHIYVIVAIKSQQLKTF